LAFLPVLIAFPNVVSLMFASSRCRPSNVNTRISVLCASFVQIPTRRQIGTADACDIERSGNGWAVRCQAGMLLAWL
jgi:hypothetical protein